MDLHPKDSSHDLDLPLINRLKELGKSNDYEGYLNILNLALKKVETNDDGEPLVPINQETIGDRVFIDLVPLGVEGSKEARLQLRHSVVQKLRVASQELPSGFSFIIRDAYRTEKMVMDLYALYIDRLQKDNPHLTAKECDLQIRNKLAMPDDPVPPGHMTGGAVDVVLGDALGNRINVEISADQKPREEQASTFCPGLPPKIMERRLILFNSLSSQGFHNYFKEYWHFSYGDAYWAVRRKNKTALYGLGTAYSKIEG